jgi:hypothetical protein
MSSSLKVPANMRHGWHTDGPGPARFGWAWSHPCRVQFLARTKAEALNVAIEKGLCRGILPVRPEVETVTMHREPTPREVKWGAGATHYRTFPVAEVCHKGTRILKRWHKAADDGLRYFR